MLTPEKNRIKAKISIDGVVSYGYRFCYPKIDEAFGPVNDAVYTYKRQSLGPMQIMEEREAANDRMIDLAADVLVAILMEERAS